MAQIAHLLWMLGLRVCMAERGQLDCHNDVALDAPRRVCEAPLG